MLVRWNDRPIPRRQRSWGAIPVTSRSLKTTRPPSGSRCPVIRLNSVVLPAPLGPMMALIEPRGTVKDTPPTAWKPSKLLRTSCTSSTGGPPREPPPEVGHRARDPPPENEKPGHPEGGQGEWARLGGGNGLL